jgi:hypothetical protein
MLHSIFKFLFVAAAFWLTGCQAPRSRFYPIGIYNVPGDKIGDVHRAGFNTVAGAAEQDYLDTAQFYKVKVLAGTGTSAGAKFNASAARALMSRYDRHPALWAWYLSDEPDLNHIAPEHIQRAHRFFKNNGARKPTAQVLYQGSSALHYGGLTDILMLDRYPIPWLPLANFPQHLRQARLALGKKKPLIAVIQAFDWTFYRELLPDEKDFRPPTAEEIRCMTYCALVHRATGLFYYSYADAKWKIEEHAETWSALKATVAEVNRRLPLFAGEHLWWPLNHRVSDPTKRFNAALESSIMPALVRVKNGNEHVPAGEYLVIVNSTPQQLSYSIKLPRPVDQVPVLDENRTLQQKKNRLEDNFEPYAVHVYGPLKFTP